jgi:hypothetical protein
LCKATQTALFRLGVDDKRRIVPYEAEDTNFFYLKMAITTRSPQPIDFFQITKCHLRILK